MAATDQPESELRTRVRQQAVVAELGQQALAAGAIDELLHDATVAVSETLDTDYCKVLELLPDGDEVFLRAGVGWRDGLVGRATVPTDRDSQAGYTLLSEEPVVVEDLRTESRFSGPELLTSHDVISGVSVIIGTVEEPWGVLGTHTTQRREFAEHDVAFVQSVANVLASAIENDETKRKLREERTLKERIAETSPVGTLVFDADGRVQFANGRAEEILGRSDDELVGMAYDDPAWELVDGAGAPIPDDRLPFRRVIDTDDSVFDVEVGVRRPDGERIWLSVNGAPLTDDEAGGDGTSAVTGAVVEVQDVTEQRAREKELERYETIVEAVNDGIYVVDGDGRFSMVNEAYVELVGYDREELLGAHTSLVVDDDVSERTNQLEAAMTEGRVSRPSMEAELLTASGERVPAEATFALLEEDGERQRVGVVRDLTRRRRMEAELRESEEQFRELAENLEEVVWMSTPEKDEMLYVNPAYEEIWGRTRESLYEEPTSFLEGIHPDDRDRVRDALPDQRRGEFDEEYRIVRPDGSIRWVRSRANPIRDDAGDVYRLVGIAEDVTERRERERALERHREFIDDVLNAVDDMFYVVNDDGTFQRWNETIAEVTGYTDEEIGEMHALEFFDGGDADVIAAGIQEVFETGSARVEAEVRTRDGEYVPYEYAASALEDPDGNRVLAGIGRDVSERKERERALEESERRYRTLVEHFPNGVVALFDEDLRYTTAGGELLEEADVDVDDAIGSTIYERYSDDIIETIKPHFRAVFEGEANAFEVEYLDRHLFAQTVPVSNGDGEIFAGMLVIQDVTEHVENRRKLEESERRYRTLVEHFPNGKVALFDDDLRYTIAGGEVLDELDTTPEEMIGMSIYERYPDHAVPVLESNYRAALEGEANVFEVSFHGRDWLVHTLPIDDGAGDVAAGMAMIQDVTEREENRRKLEETIALLERSNEQLERSNEQLERFAYAASHDLQEPLRMVSSYLTLIEQRYGDELDDDGREFLDFAVDGADRMRAMVDGLLEYSRVDARGRAFEPVDCDDVLEDVLEDLSVMIDEHDATVTAEALPTVYGDASQLGQVFQNLLRNAIEYCEERPQVHVTAERSDVVDGVGDDRWVIAVHDNGIGIEPEEREQIFGVFQRLHAVDEYSGTGIGLALCRRIVERHGGEIWVDSEPGEGSTFRFTVPTEEIR